MTPATSTVAADQTPGTSEAEARKPCVSGHATTFLRAPDLDHVVALHDSDGLVDALRTVMPDWTLAPRPDAANSGSPLTRVTRPAEGYAFHSRWANEALTGLGIAGATCGVVADLMQAWLDARPGVFGLHCGAVRIGGHLVAFTGTYRAGKTTLVTRLGTETRCELFCDDVLPIEPDGAAVALGVQPRLRLPLPEGTSHAFRSHVNSSLTVRDRRYGYVATPRQAPRGTRATLAALVVLSRQPGARARFHQLDTGNAAASLIRQNLADPGEIEAHYDRVAAMVEKMTCLTLVYSDIEEAVALIRRTFDAPSVPRLDERPGPALPATEGAEASDPVQLDRIFHRAETVVARKIGTDTFLWEIDGRHFFNLNAVGGAVWSLLEEPVCGRDIVACLQDAFPDVPGAQIGRDVALLLGQFIRRDLIVASPPVGAPGAGSRT